MTIKVGIFPTDVRVSTESPAFTLGTRGCISGDTGGDKDYVYVRANGAVAVSDIVQIDESFDATPVSTTTTAPGTGQGLPCGVAVAVLEDNGFGWVQVGGLCGAINVATSCAAHTALNSTGTGGRVDDDATAGAEVISGITTTAAESSNTAAGVLVSPFVGRTL